MQSFDHVISKTIRDVLTFKSGGDTVADALTETERCFRLDLKNKMLDRKTIQHREEALDSALFLWNEEGNEHETVQELRRYWS